MRTKLTVRCVGAGRHGIFSPDDSQLGELDDGELRQYAENVLGMKGGGSQPGSTDMMPTTRAPYMLPGDSSTRLNALMMRAMKDKQLSEEQALNSVLTTEEGKALWEKMRLQQLEESSRSARRRR